MKKRLFVIIAVIFPLSLFAQRPIGTFRSHTAMKSFASVAVDDATIYAASENSLMLLEKSSVFDEEPELSSWSKVEGLSDIGIAKIFHEETYNSLVVCYQNGNIDIIRDGKLVNIRDVKDKSLNGSKIVRNCRAEDGLLYLVYPFGIVIMDMKHLVISDTWFTKRNEEQYYPTDIAVFQGRYYISTTEGVFSIPVSSVAISDFAQWQVENNWNIAFLAGLSDRLVGVRTASEEQPEEQDSLCVLDGSGWRMTGKGFQSVRGLLQQHDTLIVCQWNAVVLLTPDLENRHVAFWYEDSGYPDVRDCALDGDIIWAADYNFGLVCYNMTYYSHRFYTMPGPFANYVESLASSNGIVVATPGSRNASMAYAPSYQYPAISWIQNQDWQSDGASYLSYDSLQNTYDLNAVAINPNDESQWAVASWGNGIFLCKNRRPVAHYIPNHSKPVQIIPIQSK